MRLTLDWRGPIGLAELPVTAEAVAALNVPAVYLRLRGYDGGRTVAYVGRTRQLAVRIDQHLTRLLGLGTALRDDCGATIYRAGFGERMAAFADLDRALAVVRDELRRLRFFYAACDDDGFPETTLALVEFALKRHLDVRLGAWSENRAEVAVSRADWGDGGLDEAVEIASRFDALPPDDARALADLLGETTVRAAPPGFAP